MYLRYLPSPPSPSAVFLICNSCPPFFLHHFSLSTSFSIILAQARAFSPALHPSHPHLATHLTKKEKEEKDGQERRRARLPRRGGEGGRLPLRPPPPAANSRPPLQLPRHPGRHLADQPGAPQVGDRRPRRRPLEVAALLGARDAEAGPECCSRLACLRSSCQAEPGDPRRRSCSTDDLLRRDRRRLRPPSQQGGEHSEACVPRNLQSHRTRDPGGRGGFERPGTVARHGRSAANKDEVAGEIL